MKPSIYISRYFVEFGPFTLAEIHGFKKREILQDSDYLRTAESEAWTPANAWLDEAKTPTPKAKPVAKKSTARKPASKAAD